MPKYKLTYFNLRGRAEINRLLFAVADVEYEDVRIDFENWPAEKNKTPLGQVPVMEIDGVEYPQSVAQHRYLATFGFVGNSALENLQCDVIVDTCNDLRKPYIRNIFLAHERTKDIEQEEEAKQKLLDEGLPKFLPIFEKFFIRFWRSHIGLGKFSHYKTFQREQPFHYNKTLTWADLAIHDILEFPLDLFPIACILKKYPKLAKHRELVESNPRIKAYLEKRPKTFA